MSQVDLKLELHELDDSYEFRLIDTLLLAVSKDEVTDELLDQVYDGLVKAFGLGIYLGQESVKNGSTGFSVKAE
ncbi:hypothetical protein [Gallaecimonas pentaromativorans]|uniref:Uncharacterized protein n=1 Tax=Gallaecimonas pentaromativorans TaxID=584787 RepID=A0A3N1P993_9GAMM|nr:hypothetical protein [Gallaecimonas pentaromativorans]ROQ23350.1 hypothetical protein EDC28_10888 [Gallaecimonas pentaromativorans]